MSEIAGRIGRPATSLSRPLKRLVEMGLVRREIPFGDPPRAGRRALYRLDDPFVRLWFRIVAPNRALLASTTPVGRRALLARGWAGLVAEAFEDLCRTCLPRTRVPGLGAWGPPSRWWRGNRPEWDLVAESEDGSRLLLGEVKWREAPFAKTNLERELNALRHKTAPSLPARYARREAVRVLFVPALAPGIRIPKDLHVVTARDMLG